LRYSLENNWLFKEGHEVMKDDKYGKDADKWWSLRGGRLKKCGMSKCDYVFLDLIQCSGKKNPKMP
jgi:hypothetical protein